MGEGFNQSGKGKKGRRKELREKEQKKDDEKDEDEIKEKAKDDCQILLTILNRLFYAVAHSLHIT